jgi:hypothetical protein
MMSTKRPEQGQNGWLGSMNCYIATEVRFGAKRLVYNGTTVDLVRVLVAAGAVAGSRFTDDQGRTRQIVAAPHDPRAGGFWATSFNLEH